MTSSAVEIERKYIIKLPKLSGLRSMPEYTESEIEQIYLDAPKGETLRIRRRTWQGRVEYIETRKIRIDKMSATELERSLTPEEYSALSERRLRGTLPIYKTRYTFRYEGQTFELDVYPRWQHTCIMETELPTRDTAVKFPEFIEIIREVTGIKEYSNAGMSRDFPDEDT